jgi:hypothetical protein
MPNAFAHAAGDEIATGTSVVPVVLKRIPHGIGNHNAASKVDYGTDAVTFDDPPCQLAITHIAFDKRGIGWNHPPVSRR